MKEAFANLPVGEYVADWQARPLPAAIVLTGRTCRLEPLNPQHHADALFHAYRRAADDRDWTYLSVGPFSDAQSFRRYVERIVAAGDPLHFSVVDHQTGMALGTLALMRQQAQHGVVEVGFVAFSRALQCTQTATEAQFLLMSYVFDQLGYRRYEWKCDSLNQRSRNAAERLGFRYEGTFRQAMIYKGRNRDTSWFSIIDKEWPLVRGAFLQWLSPDNFDQNGQQINNLRCIRDGLMTAESGGDRIDTAASVRQS